MDTSNHTLGTLFQQLGLPNQPKSIDAFINNHSLSDEIPLEHAAFWNAAQAQLIKESIEQDADWAVVVDQLDSQLRHR